MDYGETGGMMTCIKKPLSGTGKYVVMDRGFFMPKGLVGMLEHGVYGTKVTNKKNWTKKCKGDTIEACFRDKEVDDVYDVCGDMDGNKYNIHFIK